MNNIIDRAKKIKKGKHYEKLLRDNATPSEKHFKKLLSSVKKQYNLKFTVKFQKGWYKDQAFFISDFYFPSTKTTIELDGKHHEIPEYRAADLKKTQYLQSIGISTIRLKNREIYAFSTEKLYDFLVKNRVL